MSHHRTVKAVDKMYKSTVPIYIISKVADLWYNQNKIERGNNIITLNINIIILYMINMNEKSTIALQLGQSIKSIRNEKKLSQEKLADLADLHPSHMGQIERGERNASIDTLAKIVNALDITFEELFKFADVTRQCKENDVLVEIVSTLGKRDIADQQFALNILKNLFEWKNQ